jgi:hypothetical protein
MDDEYQHIIRRSPVDRKPDRAALDAALEAEMQAPRALRCYPFALYDTAVDKATIGISLVKEVFDNIVAFRINDPPPHAHARRFHICDPAQYRSAIENATLEGWLYKDFFDKFVATQVIFHQVVKIERPLLAEGAEAHQPYGAQVDHDSIPRTSLTPCTPQPYDDEVEHELLSRPQSAQRHESLRSFDTRFNTHSPDHALARPRLRYANTLAEQEATSDAVKRGRDDTAGRSRSRSPATFEQAFPTVRASRQPGHLRDDQQEVTTLRARYRDRGPAFRRGASRNHEFNDVTRHTPTLLTPGTAQEPTTGASPHCSPRSVSDYRHHTTLRTSHLTRDSSRTLQSHTPEAVSYANHPPAYHPPSNGRPSHLRNVPDHDRHGLHGNKHENDVFVSTSAALQSSARSHIEPMQEKNQSAVCVECWSRNLKCDSRAHCRECARANRLCTYVHCPLKDCPKTIICPAYHSWTGDENARVVGSSMHLLALLRLDSPSSLDYNLTPIRNMYSKPDSAAKIYHKIASELEEAVRNGRSVNRKFVNQLFQKHEVVCRALMHKVDLIVTFIAEKK